MDNRPVVFIDSGIGGIPYAHFFHSRNKREKLIYAADRANFPYGPRSRENVIELASGLVKKLISKYDPKILVVACNAISVSALAAMRETFPGLPIVGTVPAIKPAAGKSLKRRIGVIGTQRAIEDPYIAELAAKYAPDCTILGEPAPDLVNFVERFWLASDGNERILAVKPWIEKFLAKGADTLVLACTHFLLLKEEFRSLGGEKLKIFDSMEGVSRRAESILDEKGLRSTLAENADDPLFIVSGEQPPEPHWEQLCRRFGFTMETDL